MVVEMDVVIRTRLSFDPDRKSISIMGLNQDPRELFLTTWLLSQALGIPEGGLLTRKTENTQDRCIPYFQGLVEKNKGGFPLEKIIDNDVSLVA